MLLRSRRVSTSSKPVDWLRIRGPPRTIGSRPLTQQQRSYRLVLFYRIWRKGSTPPTAISRRSRQPRSRSTLGRPPQGQRGAFYDDRGADQKSLTQSKMRASEPFETSEASFGFDRALRRAPPNAAVSCVDVDQCVAKYLEFRQQFNIQKQELPNETLSQIGITTL